MDVTPALVAGDRDSSSCLGLPLTSDCGVSLESIFIEWKEVRWLCDDVCDMRREGDVMDASWMLHVLSCQLTEIMLKSWDAFNFKQWQKEGKHIL